MSGVLEGPKLQLAIDTNFPDGIFTCQGTQQYKICFKRSLKIVKVKYSRLKNNKALNQRLKTHR
jgi:hypothetical protein